MLTGRLVRLREHREEDIKLAQEFFNNPEVVKTLYFGTPYPVTYADQKSFLERSSAFKDDYNFAIETIEEPRYIGSCGIKCVDWKNSRVELGISIGERRLHGKGYGTDAIATLVGFIFDEMNINKIKLEVVAFNEGAIRCYEKAGFKKEGLLKREIYRGGRYHDLVVMAIFRADYFRTDIKRAVMV